MAQLQHMASYGGRECFTGNLFNVDTTKPLPNEGIWCLKLNDELLLRGKSNWKDGKWNLTGTINQIKQGDIDEKWVKDFFNHHISPVLESSEIPVKFHPADIPKACAKFWNTNCVFSYEKIDTRKKEWWKSLQHDGPFEDLREAEGGYMGLEPSGLNYQKDFSEEG